MSTSLKLEAVDHITFLVSDLQRAEDFYVGLLGGQLVRRVDRETLVEAVGRARYAYDQGGEDHYNLISAYIKSLRNSDVDAALYWLARLIEGGADPVFIARRQCIFASEDVGLVDPQAMVQAAAAAQIVQLIGLPEGLYYYSVMVVSHIP